MSSGILAGFPVVDVTATLYDGSYHDVDSSVLAFQIAARGAFREGMRKGNARLLEPIMKVLAMPLQAHIIFGGMANIPAMRFLAARGLFWDAFSPCHGIFGFYRSCCEYATRSLSCMCLPSAARILIWDGFCLCHEPSLVFSVACTHLNLKETSIVMKRASQNPGQNGVLLICSLCFVTSIRVSKNSLSYILPSCKS